MTETISLQQPATIILPTEKKTNYKPRASRFSITLLIEKVVLLTFNTITTVRMQKSVITKKTKSTDEKPSFLCVFQEHYTEHFNNKIPIVKILSSEPKPGCAWLTYPQGSNTVFNDDTVTIYIAKEHFGKDGPTKKIYIKNEEINDTFLTSIQGSLHKYNSVTTLKLENCNLSANDINILQGILKEFKNITDLNVDNNPNKHQNYYVLLRYTNIKYLSLQGCRINKYGLERICQELTFDSNSHLAMLNLTSNYIDDTALSCLAQILRENRKITSLILADNWITDTGCQELMSVFQKFTLTDHEIQMRRRINLNYFIQKAKLLEQYKQDCSKSAGSLACISHTRRKSSAITTKDKSLSAISRESSILSETQKTELYIEKYLPKITHPFVIDSVAENGEIYCAGNLTIAHLNLACNKLTSSGYKYVIDTLRHQLTDGSGKSGLLNIVLDGNYDRRCHEFLEIKQILLEQRKFANRDSKMKHSNRRSVYSSITFK